MKPMSALRSAPARQRGVVLFVAMIVLIVMTLAGLALLRQMGIGTSIAGNVAFKQNATYVADRGAEVAIAYLRPPAPAVTDTAVDNFPLGYASSWVDGDDPVALPWAANSLALADDPIVRDIAQTSNTANVLIQRLCQTANLSNLDPAQRCSDILEDNPLRSHGGLGSIAPPPSTTPMPFYRVTTRVLGPRGTTTYTQVLVH